MEVLRFLENNWKVIFEIVVLLTTIILWIIRKRPVQVVDTLKETIIRLLPYCIRKAEHSPKGEKLAACLTYLGELLSDMDLPFTKTDQEFAAEQVEIILSTPQKKGVISDEK